ncbi:hypothetical protein [Viridibacillus arvi]|uniref:hypothetical protein n=1 Tax=Viridibacillus arvi TaxID=263475 RepID=UPI0034CDEB33
MKANILHFIKGIDFTPKILAEGEFVEDHAFFKGEKYEIIKEDDEWYYFKPFKSTVCKLPKSFDGYLFNTQIANCNNRIRKKYC